MAMTPHENQEIKSAALRCAPCCLCSDRRGARENQKERELDLGSCIKTLYGVWTKDLTRPHGQTLENRLCLLQVRLVL